MSQIILNKPGGGQMTISPEDGATNETITIPRDGIASPNAVGKVLKVTPFEYGSPLSMGNYATYIVSQFGGTFNKQSGSSKIYATCTIYGNNFESGNCGVGLVVDNTTWDHGVGYQYDGAWSDAEQTQIVIGTCDFGQLTSGNHTINFGWRHYNGNTGRPFQTLSPNNGTDPRNQQYISRIVVWEVEQ